MHNFGEIFSLILLGKMCGLFIFFLYVRMFCITGSPSSKKERINQMKTNTKRQRASFSIRAFAIIFCIISIFSLQSISVGAANDYQRVPIYLEGGEFLDGLLINEITYVPLRAFADASAPHTYSKELKVYWDGKNQSAVIEGNQLYIIATQGKCYITVNGRCFYTVGEIVNLNGSIYLPIRPIAKALGLNLEWDGSLFAVSLTPTGERTKSASEVYNSDDLYWLSRIISAEAGGEIFKGKLAVGNVVLNRVRHSSYPNSIWGVIFDRKHGTQFTPAATGTIYNTPTAESILAAKACLEGYSLSDTALFFLNPRIATNFWIVNTRPFEFRIGNHDFYG